MFSTISWEIFFTTALLIAGGYYGISLLLLYAKEITGWFKTRFGNSIETVAQTSVEKIAKPLNIMGSVSREDVAGEQRMTSVNEEDINVGDDEEVPETITPPAQTFSSNDHLLVGSVADLLQEIKTLVQLVAEYKSDKAEAESLFRTLLLRYSYLRATTYQHAISFYICEAARTQFAFEVQIAEVISWWNEEKNNQSH